MKVGFTPGPWHVGADPHNHSVYADQRPNSDVGLVADVSGGFGMDDDWSKRREANTSLIAAATDLYAAAEEALRYVSDDEMRVSADTLFMVKLAAALKKADGDSNNLMERSRSKQ